MASITLKNIPEELLVRLRRRAREERRSLNQQALYLLDRSLSPPAGPEQTLPGPEAETQAAAWRELAGLWVSDRPVDDEIASIYAARSQGRKVSW